MAAAWHEVAPEIIKKAFLTCGISNAVDGSEDHLVLAHMKEPNQVDVNDEVEATGVAGDEFFDEGDEDDDEEEGVEEPMEEVPDLPNPFADWVNPDEAEIETALDVPE